jgi:hypothetical protein
VQIPNSIHRLRLPGGGSRFGPGGATLQEIVVALLAVNKKRKSDTRLVNVEVWPESDKITTGQVAVRLFQSEPESDKVPIQDPHQRHDLRLLPQVQPGDGPSDDHALDLRRALENGEARGGAGSFRR